jgi:hypothetical protein
MLQEGEKKITEKVVTGEFEYPEAWKYRRGEGALN